MAGATVTVDIREVSAALGRMLDAVRNLRPLFAEIGEDISESTRARFQSQTAPDGTPWAPLSAKYIASKRKRRSRGPNKILTLTGAMGGTIAYQLDPDAVRIGSNRLYAATQQFGRGPIPARPFLGLSTQDRETIVSLTADYFERALKGD